MVSCRRCLRKGILHPPDQKEVITKLNKSASSWYDGALSPIIVEENEREDFKSRRSRPRNRYKSTGRIQRQSSLSAENLSPVLKSKEFELPKRKVHGTIIKQAEGGPLIITFSRSPRRKRPSPLMRFRSPSKQKLKDAKKRTQFEFAPTINVASMQRLNTLSQPYIPPLDDQQTKAQANQLTLDSSFTRLEPLTKKPANRR